MEEPSSRLDFSPTENLCEELKMFCKKDVLPADSVTTVQWKGGGRTPANYWGKVVEGMFDRSQTVCKKILPNTKDRHMHLCVGVWLDNCEQKGSLFTVFKENKLLEYVSIKQESFNLIYHQTVLFWMIIIGAETKTLKIFFKLCKKKQKKKQPKT